MQRIIHIFILLLIAGLGIHSCFENSPFVPGSISAYLLLMLFPGAALYLLLEKNPRPLELALASIIISPILVGMMVLLIMVFGLIAKTAAIIIASLAAVLCIVSFVLKAPFDGRWEVSRRQALTLVGIIGAFCIFTGYLPLSDEWWRSWSDAWFHRSVIAEIADYGIPPEDPYFYGMPLQYMWFYHILVLTISQAVNIDPSIVMTFFNIQALIGFILVTFLLSLHLRNHFPHGAMSVLTAILGLNALFWLFLPVEIVRALTGETSGMEEVSRVLSLSPLNVNTVRSFLIIYYNWFQFIGKFIVLTSFSLGLCFMAACWYGTTIGLTQKRAFPMVFVFFAAAGMVAFHPIVAFGVIPGLAGGLALLFLNRSLIDRDVLKRSLMLILLLLLSVLIFLPYLYLVTHGKESGHLSPFNVSFQKTFGLIISCALGIFLAVFQRKRMFSEQTPKARFFLLATVSTIIFCLIANLPGGNKYDKLPFFVFYPLSVAGGWTLAELTQHKRPFFRKKPVIVLILIILFLPVNLITALGYYNTQPQEIYSPQELEIAEWVQTNTSRDAVFIDSENRVFLLVAGPRRYYYGSYAYAIGWGYNEEEMDRRKRAVDNIYSDEPLENSTLALLSTIDPDVYVILRDSIKGASRSTKLLQMPDTFNEVFSTGSISVLKVNKTACRRASDTSESTDSK